MNQETTTPPPIPKNDQEYVEKFNDLVDSAYKIYPFEVKYLSAQIHEGKIPENLIVPIFKIVAMMCLIKCRAIEDETISSEKWTKDIESIAKAFAKLFPNLKPE